MKDDDRLAELLGQAVYLVELHDRIRHMADDMLIAAMLANGEDPTNTELYKLRKAQVMWGAEKP